jgi:uncharacterized protein YjiS (DUF1127 family)
MSGACIKKEFTQNIAICETNILNSAKRPETSTKKWLTTVNTWIQRSHQRKQLARLDKRLLEDIGLTEEIVAKEIAKPFWK